MIEGNDIRPERKLYYLGALLLEIINDSKHKNIDYLDLFENLCEREKVSMTLFTVALDWLFMLHLVESDGRHITKCF